VTCISEALANASALISGAEARLLMRHVLGRSHAWLLAHDDEAMTTDEMTRYAELLAHRSEGMPVAYLLGSREFYGRTFAVTREVLIPRPESELLVDLGIAKLRGRVAPAILDLGAGSGCLAVTLALEIPTGKVIAADLLPAAVALARHNAERLGAALKVIESDWFSAVSPGDFDLIVANPPYIAAHDPHLGQGDLRFEPPLALSSGPDGLAAIRTIIRQAPGYLAPGGWLFIEHGYDQAVALVALLQQAGFSDIEQHPDLAGILRVSGGRMGVKKSAALDVGAQCP